MPITWPISARKSPDRLQSSCLKCIVDNFGLFMTAYSIFEADARFEFLQRKFSKELLHELKRRKTAQKYLFFVLNPHLKELDLNSCNFVRPEPVLHRMGVIGKSIEYLCLDNQTWSEGILIRLLALLPSVKMVTMKNSKCSDKVLKTIGESCPYVSTIDVSLCSNISDDGIENFLGRDEKGNLKNNTELCDIDLTSTNVSGKGLLTILTHATSLRTVYHKELAEVICKSHVSNCTDSSYSLEAPKYNLTELELISEDFSRWQSTRTPLLEVLHVCSAVCPKVTSLAVEGPIDGNAILACTRFKLLQNVHLLNRRSMLSSTDVNRFLEARGKRLQNLNLENVVLSVGILGTFCKELRMLTLRNVAFDASGEPSEGISFCRLSRLTVHGANFSEEADMNAVMLLVSSSLRLEKLSLPCSRSFSEAIARKMAQCKCMNSLRYIDASFSDLKEAAALTLVAAAPKLDSFFVGQYLNLFDCGEYHYIMNNVRRDYTNDDDDCEDYDPEDPYDCLYLMTAECQAKVHN